MHSDSIDPCEYSDANLAGANFRGSDLRDVDFRGSDLTDADFLGAVLVDADFRGAVLVGANFRDAVLTRCRFTGSTLTDADLRDADLTGVGVNWRSHELVAEILRRHAGDDMDKRMLAGLILISKDWCWSQFAQISHPQRQWAIDALASHLREDDAGPGPDFLRKYRTR